MYGLDLHKCLGKLKGEIQTLDVYSVQRVRLKNQDFSNKFKLGGLHRALPSVCFTYLV